MRKKVDVIIHPFFRARVCQGYRCVPLKAKDFVLMLEAYESNLSKRCGDRVEIPVKNATIAFQCTCTKNHTTGHVSHQWTATGFRPAIYWTNEDKDVPNSEK